MVTGKLVSESRPGKSGKGTLIHAVLCLSVWSEAHIKSLCFCRLEPQQVYSGCFVLDSVKVLISGNLTFPS